MMFQESRVTKWKEKFIPSREQATYGGIVDKLQERFADALLGFDLQAIARRVLHKERGGYVIGADDATFWDVAASNAIVNLPHLK